MEQVRNLTQSKSRSFVRRLPLFPAAVRFQETIFSLPFAYAGMVLAADGLPMWRQVIWITVALVGARTLGMSANRIIDRHIDARNPRTVLRHLPAGLLSTRDMMVLMLVSTCVFLFAAWQLNTMALVLAPVAAVYLIMYPYAKRFTWGANLILGWALAIAPAAAWIGVRGNLSWEVVLLSAAVAMWAGSFDILYHVQDVNFYTCNRLCSVAQRFGVRAALRWARTMDGVAIILLVSMGVIMDLAYPYYTGCIVAAGLLVYKHRLVSADDLSHMGVAFFRINAYVSTSVFVAVMVAVLASG